MEVKKYEGNGRMSRVVECNGILYLCGQTAPEEKKTVKEQTEYILGRLEDALTTYGSDKDHVLSALIHLKDMSTFEEMNAVWDAWVNSGHEPARTCVEARLCADFMLVEITLTAAVR